ncbi:MAG: sugar-binding protein, partial [Bacteroidota bacterium]
FIPKDHSGLQLDYQLAEDGEYLYLGALVQDDDINTDTSRSVWGQDNIGWVVSGLPLSKSFLTRGNNWYRQESGIRITPANSTYPSKTYLSEGTPENAQFVCTEVEGGYVLEAAVPISWIQEQQGENWKSVRINFLMDDVDQNFQKGERFFAYPDWRRDDNILGSGTFFRQ